LVEQVRVAQARYNAVSPNITNTRAKEARWGWFPALTLLNATALMLVSVAFTASRNQQEWSTALFWVSLLLIFVPTAYRLSMPSIARRERLGLIVVAGLAFYLVKVLHSPLYFSLHDEFLHWRTAIDIVMNTHLFSDNTILTVSPLYPGLEVVTTAFSSLSGLSIFQAGIVMLGVARIVFMLALYLFYEYVAQSPQIGAIAALLYMGNSNFLFFDSQFSYESLALPIATAVLFAVLFRQRSGDRGLGKLLLLILPMITLVAMTHHLTAYVLLGFLGLWTVVALFWNRIKGEWLDVGIITVLGGLIVVGWSLFAGNITSGYLGPVIQGGVSELVRLILNEESGRQLFQSATGQDSAVWERVIGILSVLFILAPLPFGVVQIWRTPFRKQERGEGIGIMRARALQNWSRYSSNPVAFAFTLLVFLQPVMQGFRLTSAGWEIANRSSEFVFWAIAFIVSIGMLQIRGYRVIRRIWTGMFLVWATVIFMGGIIAGWPPWARLPGSYLVSADSRSIEPQGIAAAQWAGEHLDPTARIAADRTNTLLLATYGHLNPVTHQNDNLYLAQLFLLPEVTSYVQQLAAQVHLRYALVDTRLSTQLPRVGVYFEAGEPNSNDYDEPASLEALTKFDRMPSVSRLFDSGDIRIYDVSRLDANP
jgi:hypothetical protein